MIVLLFQLICLLGSSLPQPAVRSSRYAAYLKGIGKRQIDSYGTPLAPQLGSNSLASPSFTTPDQDAVVVSAYSGNEGAAAEGCTTVYETECNTVTEQQCNTVQDQQCSTVQRTQCNTVNEQQCKVSRT